MAGELLLTHNTPPLARMMAGTAKTAGKLLFAAFYILSMPLFPGELHLAFTDIGCDAGMF